MSWRMYPLEKIDHPLFLMWKYNIWANEIFIKSSESISSDDFLKDLGDGCGSLKDKLAHIFAADEIWLQRIESTPNPSFTKPDQVLNLEDLKSRWIPIQEKYISILHDPNTDYKKNINYKNFKGKEFETSLYEVLLHVANHATYHRGQAASLLRRLTGKPPITDLMEYFKILPNNS
jgi:uncharacterized damage-inducible protein DinB